jgi:hypothetical protein
VARFSVPSVRCAGQEYSPARTRGSAIASAWSIRPRFRSSIMIVPPTIGRLVAEAPQYGSAPGQEPFV